MPIMAAGRERFPVLDTSISFDEAYNQPLKTLELCQPEPLSAWSSHK